MPILKRSIDETFMVAGNPQCGEKRNTDLLGYTIYGNSVSQSIKTAIEWIEKGSLHRYMACANPHSLVVASRDSLFKTALQYADILLPDGAGIVMAGKILHLPIKQRVTGNDFFLALSDAVEKSGRLRYFFLGSSADVLNRIRQRLRVEYPSIDVCGTYSPPYKDEFDGLENEVMIDLINKAKPDVLWVGMTAPKQEKWVFQNRERIKVPFIAAVGAVFDFYAGTKKRSSPFWQKLGLEWLPRFLKEPRRLWERNMKSMPIFILWVLMEKIRRMRNQ